ncbi:LysR family transcriptional regulator [Chromatiales bacterium (ex Bugula neritina AB1)]|nr:LysR family transcriptional regulator [Chromatiales bacterium (ex Bugula neritina AB1)]
MREQATPLLELDLLRTLVAIAETGNFSAAASQVHRTPSAISMQVKKLEELVRRPLFIRDSRSVKMTEDGEVLLAHARRVLALNREVVSLFETPALSGTVRLGAPDNLVERALPALMRRFSETYCCIAIDVVIDSAANLEKSVRSGDLDLALIIRDPVTPLPEGFEIVFREPLVWAGARHGVAYEQDQVPISVWHENCSWRRAGVKALEAAGRDYRIAFKSAHIAGQRAAIKTDLAIAPFPESSCIDGIVALGPKEGLPVLTDYEVALIARPSAPEIVMAALEYIKVNLSEKIVV